MIQIEQIRKQLATYKPINLPPANCKQAAVTMLLREMGNGAEILLIRRAEHDLDPWSGDLGFPGGRIEITDTSPRGAAEREAWEEVGLQLKNDNYLGQTDDLTGAYLAVHISCFIYTIKPDQTFTLNDEIVDYFWLPISTLLEPARSQQQTFYYRGKNRTHPIIELTEWSPRPLWGITYRIISNFLTLFNLSLNRT